jgi:hypothetical protein
MPDFRRRPPSPPFRPTQAASARQCPGGAVLGTATRSPCRVRRRSPPARPGRRCLHRAEAVPPACLCQAAATPLSNRRPRHLPAQGRDGVGVIGGRAWPTLHPCPPVSRRGDGVGELPAVRQRQLRLRRRCGRNPCEKPKGGGRAGTLVQALVRALVLIYT